MVRRNAEGSTGRRARIVRLLGWTALATFAIGATSASAANVSEVRVGTHDKSTRIVLELDQASGYRLVTPKDGSPELVIQLDAASVARDVPSKSPLVRKVRVEPSSGGSTVHVRLATSNVAVKELLLASPPRLVFDLTAQGPIPKAPADEEVADEAAAPASVAKDLASAPAPAPALAKADEPKPAAEAPKPIVVAAAAAKSEPAAAEAAPAPVAKLAMPPAPVAPAADPPKPADEAMAPPSAPSQGMNAPTREASPPPVPSPQTSGADARRKALAAKAQQPAESGGSILSVATSPLGLGAIAAAVLLLGGIFVMRRRRGDEDDESLYSMMSAEDGGVAVAAEAGDRPEPVRAAPIWEPDAFDASEPTPKQGPHQLNLGSRPVSESVAEIAAPDDSDADSIFGGEQSAPVIVAPARGGEPERSEGGQRARGERSEPSSVSVVAAEASGETERRIAELERRIEQLADARERLERQVAAQTEELRVQRAAIARTQRVVRSIAKTEDMATEPVPRAPSAS